MHNYKFFFNVSESNVKDESRKAAGNVIDLMPMRENCTVTISCSRMTN